MFESLTDKLTGIFQSLTGKGRLTEKDVDEALRQIRLALLEADVWLGAPVRMVRSTKGQILPWLT